jgi:ElaB/YqjD/DUF883 family membrane-anchored ribosome-binding protein
MSEQDQVNSQAENAGCAENAAEQATPEEPQATEGCKIHSAADAVRRAREELHKAQELYDKVRQEATERIQKVRKTTFGDVMDCTLETVRKHPGAGLTVAAALGFVLGRIFRR